MHTHTLIYAHMQLISSEEAQYFYLLFYFFFFLLLLYKLNLKQTTEEKIAGLQSFSSRKRIELKDHICYPYGSVGNNKWSLTSQEEITCPLMEKHIAT